jgi:ribonuclease VapC
VIVVDASALVAVFENEPERKLFSSIIANADRRLVSTVTLLEAEMVARSRRGPAGLAAMQAIIEQADIEIVPFDAQHLTLAIGAFERYGKGIKTTARLNLGDCCSYALAKALAAPLLFKGNDFSDTDIVAAANL